MANDNKTFFAKGVSSGKTFNWKDLFSGVFQKHTKDDTDATFAAGLKGYIPSDDRLLEGWHKPWVFSRVLLYGIIAWLIISLFSSLAADIGSILLVPTAVVPISLVLFFWEMNVPRNIPFYVVLKLFIFGGVGTGVVWFFIHLVISNDSIPKSNYMYWLIVGIVEELTKLVLVSFAIRKAEYRWGLNGFVIGAAVGCGFAVFETVSYVVNSLIAGGVSSAMTTLNIRGVTAIDGHVIWAAIYGAALAMSKGKQKLEAKHYGDSTFLITFFASIVIHATFDYYDVLVDTLFGANSAIGKLLNYSGFASAIIMAIVFAIPNYALALWVMRKSIRQVVTYAGGVGRSDHQDQVVAGGISNNGGSAGSNVSASAAVLVLECISGELAGQSYTIQKGRTFTIGRGKQNNIQYSDGAKGISRSHCSVTFDGTAAIVTDLGSTHGTFFENGSRFQAEMRNSLRNGDTFYLAAPRNTFRITIR